MIRRNLLGLSMTLVAFASLPGSTLGQQTAPTLHRYLSRAVLTEEGVCLGISCLTWSKSD
jgi:hypothetical protein